MKIYRAQTPQNLALSKISAKRAHPGSAILTESFSPLRSVFYTTSPVEVQSRSDTTSHAIPFKSFSGSGDAKTLGVYSLTIQATSHLVKPSLTNNFFCFYLHPVHMYTVQIQINVLATLLLKFQVLYDKNLNHAISKQWRIQDFPGVGGGAAAKVGVLTNYCTNFLSKSA